MAAIATTRQPDATKMPAGGNADGRLHTFNDLRMRLRQNLPFDQWTGILRASQCRLHCCTVRGRGRVLMCRPTCRRPVPDAVRALETVWERRPRDGL